MPRPAGFAFAVYIFLLFSQNASAAPIISGNYYEEDSFATCDNTSACKIRFAAVSAGKKLLITQVSCEIQAAGNNAELRGVNLAINGNPLRRLKTLLPNLIYTSAGNAQRTYVVGQTFQFLVGPATSPAVSTFFSTAANTINLVCQIVGTIS